MAEPRLNAVLVTYRRPAELERTINAILSQTRPPDVLLVVDNAPSQETEAIVRRARDAAGLDVRHLAMPDNAGYTGGLSVGMKELLVSADDDDWIVACDDDDPPDSAEAFAELFRFALEMRMRDATTAGVGLGGGRFDLRTGRVVRVPTSELSGPVSLDYIAGNFFGCYRVAAIRQVGPFDPDIFFGFSEGEFGLRLRRAGYSLWGHGEIWRARRIAAGRGEYEARPSRAIGQPEWRRYYSLRNLIYILRMHGRTATALRVSAVHGVGKPLANLPVAPAAAIGHLRLNVKAIHDGWRGRMGRRVDPVPWGPRPRPAGHHTTSSA